MKTTPLLTAVVMCLAAIPSLATELVGVSVVNVSDRCGDGQILSLQFFGSRMSPRLELAPGGDIPFSLERGLYQLSVTTLQGDVLEEMPVVVREKGFRLVIGCPFDSSGLEGVSTRPDQKTVEATIVNRMADCGTSRSVKIYREGRMLGELKDGGQFKSRLPVDACGLDLAWDGARQMILDCGTIAEKAVISVGCTDQNIEKQTDGIPILFVNTTDQCTEASRKKFLTLWVDGMALQGIGPGKQAIVRVPAGKHEFDVNVGFSRERMVQGARNVDKAFRIHYGCGR